MSTKRKSISEVLGTRVLPFEPPKDLSFQRRGRESSFGPYFVSFALPGNVVTRFGTSGDYEWIPPEISGRSLVLLPDNMTLKPQSSVKIEQLPTIPTYFYALMGTSGNVRFNRLVEINPQDFAPGDAHEGRWLYCLNCNNVFHTNLAAQHMGHDARILKVETRSYAIEYSTFTAEGPNPIPVSAPPLLTGMTDELLFYDRSDHRIAVQGGVMGAFLSLRFRDGTNLGIPLQFVANGEPAIISTERINTEGFLVRIRDELGPLIESETGLELRESAFATSLVFDLQNKHGIGKFDAEAVANLFLTTLSIRGDISESDFDKLHPGQNVEGTLVSHLAQESKGDFNEIFNLVLREIYLPSNPELAHLVSDLLQRDQVKESVRSAIRRYRDKKSVAEFAKVSFVHSLAHAMVNAANVVGGNEFADEYYRDFNVDKSDGQFAVAESEPATGGIRLIRRNYWETPLTRGVMRSSARDYSFILEDFILDCPIRDTEFFIEEFLYRSPTEAMKNLQEAVRQSRTPTQLRSRIMKLVGQSPPVHPVFADRIRQVTEDLDLNLEGFMLFHYLRKKLGRFPTQQEFAWLIGEFGLISRQYHSDLAKTIIADMDAEVVQKHSGLPRILAVLKDLQDDIDLLKEQLLKRTPHTCAFSCPACLGVECNFLDGVLARVLNQELLRRVVLKNLSKQAVSGKPAAGRAESLARELKETLAKRNRAYLILEPSEQSVLTDIRSRLIGTTVNENRIYDCDSRIVRDGDRSLLLSQFGVVRKP